MPDILYPFADSFSLKMTLALGEPLAFTPIAPLETAHRSQVHFFHTPGALSAFLTPYEGAPYV